MKRVVLFLLLLGIFLPIAFAQTQTLTNDDVIRMVNAQLSDQLIIATLKASNTSFDTSPSAMQQLRSAGVPQAVLDAMLQRSAQKPTGDSRAIDRRPLPTSATSDTRARSNLPLIYVEEVSSTGGVMASSDTTLEAMKTLQQHGMRVTTTREKADYILQVTRQLGKKRWSKDTKIALSNREGEVVLTKSTRSIGGAMGDVVDFVRSHSE